MSRNRIATWLHEIAPDAEFVARNSSVLGIRLRGEVGSLPIALGDAEPDLVRVIGSIPELTRAWRLLAYPDQPRSRRFSAFFDFIAKKSISLNTILAG